MSNSVAEHLVMSVLALELNYLPSTPVGAQGWLEHRRVRGRSYDVERMHVGTVTACRTPWKKSSS
ncbi:hypothetical protein JFU04_15585 [Pseudomonas sp. TH21]|uniref:hypothetical protein n=1 Tax=Pseudomonas sp. TH21 TaxID=2796387 RepID=UPI0019129E96|nr:hypothetical protein [Pseudomonas sp. TH21]MBK5477511.1 hypothetical protein [Pseudomonas sp. TH21]